jgi:peptidoglycan/LPS O-acetylase OafA/YrhL
MVDSRPGRLSMAQTIQPNSDRKFIPSLEGVRGYAFLIVFFHHCCDVGLTIPAGWRWFPLRLLEQLGLIALPVFFVLSGYLICGILIGTREREGYFRVFYSHRFLRVIPLYYLTLICVGLVCAINGYKPGFLFWSQFLYIHNLFPSYASIYSSFPWQVMAHLWSMGVEEQFYLIWPLIVWICPNRRILLRVTLILIAISFTLRLVAAWMKMPTVFMYYWTPTRVDAILLGATLAMIRGKTIYRLLESSAQYVALGGFCAIALLTEMTKQSLFRSAFREAAWITLWNIMGAAIVIAVMRDGSFLGRVCSKKGIRWLGARSYGLYLFHFTYLGWFFHLASPLIARSAHHKAALFLVGAIALGVTVLLAAICYRFIEEPAMKMKKRIKYGAPKSPAGAQLTVSA